MKRLLLVLVLSAYCCSCGNDVPPSVWEHEVKESADTVETRVQTPREKLADRMDRGQNIFYTHCASCHHLFKEATGPALSEILSQWHYDTVSLNAFIRNPANAIHVSKMPKALESWEKYKPTMMTAFPALSNSQLNDIYAYLQHTPRAIP